MIIKSMPRKDASFSQLMAYITDEGRAEQKNFVFFNTFYTQTDEVLAEFQRNAEHIKARKNGNYMYHEILSLKAEDGVNQDRRKEALRAIAFEYLKNRAGNSLAFGGLHEDHEGHVHYHLMISANEIGTSKKTRLTKAEFAQLKAHTEAYVLENYPELKQSLVMGKAKDFRPEEEKRKRTNKEVQVKKRTGQTRVEQLSEAVGVILANSKTQAEFQDSLQRLGLEYYQRGKTAGIKEADGTKYRFSRLGLGEALNQLQNRSNQPQEQKRPENHQANKDEYQQKPDFRESQGDRMRANPEPEKRRQKEASPQDTQRTERERIAEERKREMDARRDQEKQQQDKQEQQTTYTQQKK